MRRDELINELRKVCDKLAFNEVVNSAVAKYCYETYNVPMGRTKDLIADRADLSKQSNASLYFLVDGIDNVQNKSYAIRYFTEVEIKKYSKEKFAEGGLVYPIEIPCIEIDPGKQWIGVIDVKLLMELKRASKIRYHANRQRTKKRFIEEDTVLFNNHIKEKSVNEIADLMIKGEYIPDDITLSIPNDVNGNNKKYDDKKHKLIFSKIEALDLTDGYHRFLAMCKCVDKYPSFNYKMEIRIIQFSEQRSRQFIYQKDQKNRMLSINSRTMDTFRPSNEVCVRLNERGSGCQLSGLIQRNGGSVDFAALSDIIEYYWFKPLKKKEFSDKEISDIFNEVKEILNGFVDEDIYFLDNRYLSFNRLIVMFWLVKEKNKTPGEAVQILNGLEERGELKKIRLRGLRKNLFASLETLDY